VPFTSVGTERPNFAHFACSMSAVSQNTTLLVAFSANDRANTSTAVSLFKLAVHGERAMILQSKEQEFRSLFSEFVKDYLRTTDGENHLRFYTEGRLKGRENFESVKAAHGDITDSVLRGLLPHTNSVAHRASGAWVHIAPSVGLIQWDCRSFRGTPIR
jgi:hypothetical protein